MSLALRKIRTGLVIALALAGSFVARSSVAQDLRSSDLRDIDNIAVELADRTKSLHDEFHHHLERQRYAASLDDDVSALEQIAEQLHEFAHDSNGSFRSTDLLRRSNNDVIRLAIRIDRSVQLLERRVTGNDARRGLALMEEDASSVIRLALRLDRYLGIDNEVLDEEADRLEQAVKLLHDEFHRHLEGYEMSRSLDRELESLETLVEHMHDLTHGRTWGEIHLPHLIDDIYEVRARVSEINELLREQAYRGVRTRDWDGFEHSQDALHDILASAYLLEHMSRKADGDLVGFQDRDRGSARIVLERPRYDRHGHVIRDRYDRDPHRDDYYDRHRH